MPAVAYSISFDGCPNPPVPPHPQPRDLISPLDYLVNQVNTNNDNEPSDLVFTLKLKELLKKKV